MAESTGLLSRRTRKGTAGSNPALSANPIADGPDGPAPRGNPHAQPPRGKKERPRTTQGCRRTPASRNPNPNTGGAGHKPGWHNYQSSAGLRRSWPRARSSQSCRPAKGLLAASKPMDKLDAQTTPIGAPLTGDAFFTRPRVPAPLLMGHPERQPRQDPEPARPGPPQAEHPAPPRPDLTPRAPAGPPRQGAALSGACSVVRRMLTKRDAWRRSPTR